MSNYRIYGCFKTKSPLSHISESISTNSYLVQDPILQPDGEIEEDMMYNTFNMGIGLVLAVAPEDVDTTMEAIKAAGDTPYVIGNIEAGEKGVTLC